MNMKNWKSMKNGKIKIQFVKISDTIVYHNSYILDQKVKFTKNLSKVKIRQVN